MSDGAIGPQCAVSLLAEIFQRMRTAGSLSWRGDLNTVDPATTLRSLGIDSIEWVSLFLELETTLGQRIYDSELAELSTLGDLLELVTGKGRS